MIILVYIILVFLVLRFSVTLFNFLSNPKLGHYGKHFTDKVSIIIMSNTPEGEDALALLAAIKEQDYQNLEIIVKLPADELQDTVEQSTGKYLLLLDANVWIGKGLINNLIYRVRVFDLKLLSLLPNRKPKSFLARLIDPLPDFVLINLFPLRLVRLSNLPAFSAASDACLFFDAASYKSNQWTELLKEKQLNGGELVKVIKQMKFKTEFLLANRFVFVDHDVPDNEVIYQLFQIFGRNTLAVLVYLILVMAGPVWLYVNFNFVFLALPLGLIFLTRVMISFLTAQNPIINLLLHPLQMLMLCSLLIRAAWNKIVN